MIEAMPGTTDKPTAHISTWVSKSADASIQELVAQEPRARYEELRDALAAADAMKRQKDLRYIAVGQLEADQYKTIRHWRRVDRDWEDLPVEPQ